MVYGQLHYAVGGVGDVTVRTFGSVRVGSAEVQRCFLAAVEVQANFAFIFVLPLTTRAFEQKQLLLTIHIISAPKLI